MKLKGKITEIGEEFTFVNNAGETHRKMYIRLEEDYNHTAKNDSYALALIDSKIDEYDLNIGDTISVLTDSDAKISADGRTAHTDMRVFRILD